MSEIKKQVRDLMYEYYEYEEHKHNREIADGAPVPEGGKVGVSFIGFFHWLMEDQRGDDR